MSSKKESTFLSMVLTLFIITLVASVALGYLYELTKGPIATSKLNKKIDAIKQVVPEFDNNPNDEMFLLEVEKGEPVEVYPAKLEGELVGVAIKTYTNKGFSGLIRVMVGLKPDGTIINYQVLEHKETPGLGTKMDDWFKSQNEGEVSKKSNKSFFNWLFGIKPSLGGDKRSVIGKNPGNINLTVSKDGGDIDAITAATISSRAFLDAITRAYEAYMKHSEDIQDSTKILVVNTEGGK